VNLNQKPNHINMEKKDSKEIESFLKEVSNAYDDIKVNIK
jgi:hypothetical protein